MTGEFYPSAEDEAIEREEMFELRQAISSLTGKQQIVLQLRYGFWDGKTYTLSQVADRMGVTVQATQQIESRALKALKNRLIPTVSTSPHDF